jgi:hypothetical protein
MSTYPILVEKPMQPPSRFCAAHPSCTATCAVLTFRRPCSELRAWAQREGFPVPRGSGVALLAGLVELRMLERPAALAWLGRQGYDAPVLTETPDPEQQALVDLLLLLKTVTLADVAEIAWNAGWCGPLRRLGADDYSAGEDSEEEYSLEEDEDACDPAPARPAR